MAAPHLGLLLQVADARREGACGHRMQHPTAQLQAYSPQVLECKVGVGRTLVRQGERSLCEVQWPQSLSAQFQRQIDLLAALIGKARKPVSLQSAATEVYRDEDVDAMASHKRVLHSLRERVGPFIAQRQAALSFEFQKVWIDNCSFRRIRQDDAGAAEMVAWLDRRLSWTFHGTDRRLSARR